MEDNSNAQPVDGNVSLEDYVKKYSMRKLVEEAQHEFETVITSRELVSQDHISAIFDEE